MIVSLQTSKTSNKTQTTQAATTHVSISTSSSNSSLASTKSTSPETTISTRETSDLAAKTPETVTNRIKNESTVIPSLSPMLMLSSIIPQANATKAKTSSIEAESLASQLPVSKPSTSTLNQVSHSANVTSSTSSPHSPSCIIKLSNAAKSPLPANFLITAQPKEQLSQRKRKQVKKNPIRCTHSSSISARERSDSSISADESERKIGHRLDLKLTNSNKFQISSKSINHQSNKELTLDCESASSQLGNKGEAVSAKLVDLGKRLLDATREGKIDQVRQLVVNSGAPFTSDSLGTTALHLASQYGHYEIADILLRGGVNRDARTKLERTALHLAAQSGSLEVVDLLLVHGCDANARDMLKMTPLHWAVEREHVCVVERLLISGADVHARSKFQFTPIDMAHDSKSREMISLFSTWLDSGQLESFQSDKRLASNANCIIKQGSAIETPLVGPVGQNTASSNEFNYHLAFDEVSINDRSPPSGIEDHCFDLFELEWKFEPDLFLANDEDEDDEDEPKVEYLMKVVDELQKENRQLRQRVEQLTAPGQ